MTVNASGDFFEETFKSFLGIKNIGDATKFKGKYSDIYLVTGTDIDIDNDHTMDRRDGLTAIITGDYNYMYPYEEEILAVKDGKDLVSLTQVGGTWTDTLLLSSVGNSRMHYADTGNGVYITNGIIIKKYLDGTISDLDAVTGNMKIPIPAGQFIEYWKNSLIVAKGSRLYMSDINKFEQVDARTGVKAFPGDITMVSGLSTGIWVGTTKGLWFLLDKDIVGKEIGEIQLKHFRRLDTGVIVGSGTKVYDITTNMGTYDKKHYEEGVIFVSKGVVICGDDGSLEDLTDSRYALPTNIREAVSISRKTGNKDQFMTILKY